MDFAVRCLADYGALMPPWLSAWVAFGLAFVLVGALGVSLVLCVMNLRRGWRGLRLLRTPGALGVVLAPEGQPPLRIEIRQSGKETQGRGGTLFWKWTETERTVSTRPFDVRMEAKSHHIDCADDFILDTELKAVEQQGTRCLRVAQLDPGTLVLIDEKRSRGDDTPPRPAVWTYRDHPTPSSGRMRIETFPNHSRHFRRSRYHAWWALILLVTSLAVLGSNCGRYFLLLWSGQRTEATVERVTVSPGRDPNTWMWVCYERFADRSCAVECANGGADFERRPRVGATIPAVVWSGHRVFEIGGSARLGVRAGLGCLVLVLLTVAFYLFRAYDLRPWYRRQPLVSWEFISPFPPPPSADVHWMNPLKLWKNPFKLLRNPFKR